MKNTLICAIFADDKFLSWTYGMFMQLVDFPKIYSKTDSQMNTILKNFNSKIEKLKEVSNLNRSIPAFTLIDESQNKDKINLAQYNKFQLAFYFVNEDFKIEEIDKTKPDKLIDYE